VLKPFRVLDPTTVEEASRELERLGDEAKVYAGGAELILLLRHGLIEAKALVNIKRIAALGGLTEDDGLIRIGATVTHHRLESDPLIQARLPLLAYAESHVGNIRVRSQGTLGGNLCFADPHADPGTALLAHETNVKIGGRNGERQLSLEEFLVGSYETALKPDEVLTALEVRPLSPQWRWSYQRIERFYRPTLNVAAVGKVDDGHLREVKLVVGCVGPKSQRLKDLEGKITGLKLDEARRVIGQSRSYLVDELQPVDDLLGSASYKVHITSVLLGRAVEELIEGKGGDHGRGA
jgi:carbon-monoxide dehydrogenase medium subunit